MFFPNKITSFLVMYKRDYIMLVAYDIDWKLKISINLFCLGKEMF